MLWEMNEDIFQVGVKALVRNNNNEILLLRVNKKRLREHSHVAYWDMPGGRIRFGEKPEIALKREIKEETGIKKVYDTALLTTVIIERRIASESGLETGLVLMVYIAMIETVSKIKISDEHIESGWFTPTRAARLLAVKYPKEFTKLIARLI